MGLVNDLRRICRWGLVGPFPLGRWTLDNGCVVWLSRVSRQSKPWVRDSCCTGLTGKRSPKRECWRCGVDVGPLQPARGREGRSRRWSPVVLGSVRRLRLNAVDIAPAPRRMPVSQRLGLAAPSTGDTRRLRAAKRFVLDLADSERQVLLLPIRLSCAAARRRTAEPQDTVAVRPGLCHCRGSRYHWTERGPREPGWRITADLRLPEPGDAPATSSRTLRSPPADAEASSSSLV